MPSDTPAWFHLEDTARRIFSQYGYQNIRLPLVENTELFVRSVGEHTDIVQKEMYAWVDALNDDHLTLRPEGTAGCVRAVIEHHLTYNAPVRLWYSGAMFRHENVQKGRQRQFHQLGVEAFGFRDPLVDAEQIVMLSQLWQALNIKDITLQINSLGDTPERVLYRKELLTYFEKQKLDADSLRRLHSNPLRILDSKNPAMQEINAQAPRLLDYLGVESRAHFDKVCAYLDKSAVSYSLNPRLVRGLDYYNRTVFEWTTDKLGAQGTLAGGGRYDGLVETLGGLSTPACGFAIGLERVLLLMRAQETVPVMPALDIYVVYQGENVHFKAFELAHSLRHNGFFVMLHAGEGSFKTQMKRADKSGAKVALILGESEVAQQSITLKLLHSGEQFSCAWQDIVQRLREVM